MLTNRFRSVQILLVSFLSLVWHLIVVFVNVLSEIWGQCWAVTKAEGKPISIASNVRFSTHLAFDHYYLGSAFIPNDFPLLNFISYLVRCRKLSTLTCYSEIVVLWTSMNITHLIKYVKCHHWNYTNKHTHAAVMWIVNKWQRYVATLRACVWVVNK